MSTRRDAGSAGLEQPSLALVRAVTRLLGPLVRLLIAKGITFTYLSNLLKTVYVAEAHKALKETAETPTVSRLSVITGLQRKDINRIMSEPPPQKSAPPAVSLGARLIGIWTGDKRFRTKAGAPAPLKPKLKRSETRGGSGHRRAHQCRPWREHRINRSNNPSTNWCAPSPRTSRRASSSTNGCAWVWLLSTPMD